ncbi:MAG: hypothetical protein GY953_09725, partial [bacterium]|nr:hypothetical protein [bacterium]
PDDGYWPWVVSFRKQRGEARQRIDEIRFELGVLAQDARDFRKQWLRQLYLDNQTVAAVDFAPGWDSYFGSLVGAASASEVSGEVRVEVDDVFYRWTGGWLGAPIQTSQIATGTGSNTRFRQRRDKLRAEINKAVARQRGLIDEALAAHAGVVESMLGQARKSGDQRPGMAEEADRMEERAQLLKLQLYDAAEWYRSDQLSALVNQLEE